MHRLQSRNDLVSANIPPKRTGRFEREARAVSSLNHPHISTLYDIGEQDPSTHSAPGESSGRAGSGTPSGSGQAIHYLVFEYLEGETLSARLEKGALPLEQTLEHCRAELVR